MHMHSQMRGSVVLGIQFCDRPASLRDYQCQSARVTPVTTCTIGRFRSQCREQGHLRAQEAIQWDKLGQEIGLMCQPLALSILYHSDGKGDFWVRVNFLNQLQKGFFCWPKVEITPGDIVKSNREHVISQSLTQVRELASD